jgi:hypothetical protein
MKKADDTKPKANPEGPSDNPFVQMSKMLSASVGRMPTQLVVLLLASLLAAVVTGLMMKFEVSGPKGDGAFPPLRIAPTESARAVESRELNGTWIHQNENSTMTIQFQNGMFELVVRKGSPQSISNYRYCARGDFRLKGNVLALGQRPDLGKPPTPEGTFYEFLPLEFKSVNVQLDLNQQLMLWTLPRSEVTRQTPSLLSVFPPDTNKPMVWVSEPAP